MDIHVNLTASSFEELKAKMLKAFSIVEASNVNSDLFHVSIKATQLCGPITGAGQTSAPKAEAEVIAETPKEEKKAKAAKKEKVVGTEIVETPKAETAALTKQDIADACQKVSGSKGLDAAKKILASFKTADDKPCRRISDIQEADYPKFIADCEKA